MNSSNTIPLVRAAVVEPFIAAAQQIGVPVEKMLRSVGLPAQMGDDAELLLPELHCWHFAQSVARTEAIPDFGLLAGNAVSHQDISTLAPLLAGCTNLYDLLKRFCAIAPLQSSIDSYVLEKDGDIVWFSQKGVRLMDEAVQVETFEIFGMIQLVQLAAGTNWRPAEIHFSFKHRTEVETADEFNPGRILFSQRYPSIAIPGNLLPLSLPGLRVEHDTDNPANLAPMPGSFSEQLRDAIIPYFGTEKPNKKLASEIAGVSPRTLQRRLAQQGTSYSRVLDQARLLKAAAMLKETGLKLLDISLILGYANAPGFTRAFRRWTGVSPRAYRQLNSAA